MKSAQQLIGCLSKHGNEGPFTALGYGLRTGFAGLDELLGGLRGGQVWLVVSDPGCGRSALATQLAGRWASGWVDTRLGLVSFREPDAAVAARLVASAGPAPVAEVLAGNVSHAHRKAADRAADTIARAPLVFGRTGADLAGMLESVEVVVIDDADLVGEDALERCEQVRDWATRSGSAALLTAPSGLALYREGSGSLQDYRWARIADVVLEIRRYERDSRFPGRVGAADLVVLRHGAGPVGAVPVAFQGAYARFVDMPMTPGEHEHPLDHRAALPVPMPEDDVDHPWQG